MKVLSTAIMCELYWRDRVILALQPLLMCQSTIIDIRMMCIAYVDLDALRMSLYIDSIYFLAHPGPNMLQLFFPQSDDNRLDHLLFWHLTILGQRGIGCEHYSL